MEAFLELLLVLNPEPLLFVNDCESEIMKDDVPGEKAVSADHDLTKWPHATRRVDRGQAADLVRRVAFLIRRDA